MLWDSWETVTIYPATLARELLECALLHPLLRDELYLQIVKQLRHNPSARSEILGVVLLDFCLECFPPSEIIENALEFFLIERGQQRNGSEDVRHDTEASIRRLHRIVYTGPVNEHDIPSTGFLQQHQPAGIKIAASLNDNSKRHQAEKGMHCRQSGDPNPGTSPLPPLAKQTVLTTPRNSAAAMGSRDYNKLSTHTATASLAAADFLDELVHHLPRHRLSSLTKATRS